MEDYYVMSKEEEKIWLKTMEQIFNELEMLSEQLKEQGYGPKK